MKVNRERIVNEFCELVSIDAESLNEREMADVLKVKFEELGFTVTEDNVGDEINGNAGNLYCYLKGDERKDPILFSFHMDTVIPGQGKTPIIHDDNRITSDGTTVLGSDDMAGAVEILEGIRMVLDSGETFGDIEILISVCEEVYGKGAARFDYSNVKSRIAYALDLAGPTGIAARRAPSIVSFAAKITGKAAHSGFEPEKGINAIMAATNAIAKIEQGHVRGLTVNVGKISGGKANNIVSEECLVTGEVRGFNHEDVIKEAERIGRIFKEESDKIVLEGSEITATCEYEYTVNIRAFDIPEDAEVCQKFRRACESLGLSGELVSTYGGSDNAFFVEKGIMGIVPSCGMSDVHSVKEYIDIEDLVKGAELVAALITD